MRSLLRWTRQLRRFLPKRGEALRSWRARVERIRMWETLYSAMAARDLRAERLYVLHRKQFLLHAEHGSPKERCALASFNDRLGAIDVVLDRRGLL